MAIGLPGTNQRLRCSHCGNLTRFDVVRTQKTHEFWHQNMAGVPETEQTVVQGEVVESITCRWCGAADGIVLVARPEPGSDPADEPGLGGTP